MKFTFFPALGKTLRLSTPTAHGPTQLVFRASLSPNDFEHFNRSRARLELWSDVPLSGRAGEEWGAIALAVDDQQKEDGGRRGFSVTIDLPTRSQAIRVSFTYRLVYPSGEVAWLGRYGQNGELVIDSSKPQFALAEGWKASGRSDLALGETRAGPIAQVAAPGIWKVSGVGKDQFMTAAEDITKGSALIFAPISTRSPLVVPTILVSSTEDATLSFDAAQGTVSIDGSGSAKLWTYSSNETSQALDSLREFAGSQFKVLDVSQDRLIVAGLGNTPTKLAAVPLHSQVAEAKHLQLPLASFSGFLGPGAPKFSIFTPASDTIAYYDFDDYDSNDATLNLTSFSGDTYILSPLHSLSTPHSTGYHISLLESYNLAPSEQTNEHLPTPPPSPRLIPIAHLSPQKPAGDLNASVVSIIDLVDAASRPETPGIYISETSSTTTVRPVLMNGRANGEIVLRTSSGSPLSPASLISHASAIHRRRSLAAMVRYMFVAGWVFFSSIIRLLLGWPRRVRSAENVRRPEVDETTPLLAETALHEEDDAFAEPDDTLQEEPVIETGDENTTSEAPVESVLAVPVIEEESEEDTPEIPDPPGQVTLGASTKTLNFDLLSAGTISFIFQCLEEGAPKLGVELNGKQVAYEGRPVGDGGILVELEGVPAGSRLNFELMAQ